MNSTTQSQVGTKTAASVMVKKIQQIISAEKMMTFRGNLFCHLKFISTLSETEENLFFYMTPEGERFTSAGEQKKCRNKKLPEAIEWEGALKGWTPTPEITALTGCELQRAEKLANKFLTSYLYQYAKHTAATQNPIPESIPPVGAIEGLEEEPQPITGFGHRLLVALRLDDKKLAKKKKTVQS